MRTEALKQPGGSDWVEGGGGSSAVAAPPAGCAYDAVNFK